MNPTRILNQRIRVLRQPRKKPIHCSNTYWTLWTGLRFRIIGQPKVVKDEFERDLINAMPKPAFYAVRRGRVPGIYGTWSETLSQVDGYSNAKYKKFTTLQDAESFMQATTSYPSTSTTASTSSSSRSSKVKESPLENVSRGRSKSPISHTPFQDLSTELQEIQNRGYSFSSSSSSTNGQGTGSVNGKGKGRERLVVYCDGSGIGNGQKGAKAGAGVWWGSRGEALSRNLSERVPGTTQTNNRGELLAVILALETCPYPLLPLEIRTDSQYTIGCMTTWLPKWLSNNFKVAPVKYPNGKPEFNGEARGKGKGEVKNSDMIKHLLVLLRRRGSKNGVRFKYVPAHVGIEGNEGADTLAKLGAGKPALPDRINWLDPDKDLDANVKGLSGDDPVNIDFEIDPGMLMTPEELDEFESGSYNE